MGFVELAGWGVKGLTSFSRQLFRNRFSLSSFDSRRIFPPFFAAAAPATSAFHNAYALLRNFQSQISPDSNKGKCLIKTSAGDPEFLIEEALFPKHHASCLWWKNTFRSEKYSVIISNAKPTRWRANKNVKVINFLPFVLTEYVYCISRSIR